MNFDDLLKDAWLAQTRPPSPPQDLTRRVRRQRSRHRLQRMVEMVLSLVALLVFGRALAGGSIEPSHWLLMPFFMVFLPMAWIIVLRAPGRRTRNASERVSTYASLRMSQLRVGLRDLWLARATAWALLAYAIAANLVVWMLAWPDGLDAGLVLLASAVAWFGATRWLSRRLRSRWLREYRAVRRLTDGSVDSTCA